ncbi:MAG: glycosylase, partial [Deltaproteobacteria bacterium]|nr:glycosylase [Deltaproteobacteria bacterium]
MESRQYMFKWEKLGKIFDPKDHDGGSWMQEFAQSASVLVFDDHIRMYFCTRPAPTPDGQYMSYLSYIDLDRNNIRNIVNVCSEPILELGALGTFDEFGTNPVSVIRAGDEIRVYYAGWTRCESVPFNGAIGMAVSRDNGNTFSRLGDGPVLSYSPEEPYLIGSPRITKFNGQWHLWYVAGKEWLKTEAGPEPVYKI